MQRSSRRHPAWFLACLAALLNAAAPVLAYAAGQPLHELAGFSHGTSPVVANSAAVLHRDRHAMLRRAAVADEHARAVSHAMLHEHMAVDERARAVSHAMLDEHVAAHDHALAREAAPGHAQGSASHRSTAHCVYCLDFAAGAPLASAPLILAKPPRNLAPLAVAPAVPALARASLRLPLPRAPPRTA